MTDVTDTEKVCVLLQEIAQKRRKLNMEKSKTMKKQETMRRKKKQEE